MRRKTKLIAVRIILIMLLAALALYINQYMPSPDRDTSMITNKAFGIVEVHFIDVGQGDAILIEADNSAMLIDAGENNKGTIVTTYLKTQNIKKLDYVIGTHPHSDHIGGLDTVLDTFEVGKIILPSVIHTTRTFEDVLDTLETNNLKITKPVVGDQYSLGSASFTIVAPYAATYENMNNYSVSIRLTLGNTSFLLVGDAETLSENEMLANGIELTSNVLKLGHHGSAYSSSKKFLDSVNPSYAVISVGKDNVYGHPHKETFQKLLDRNIKVYRTDEQGSVVFTSDGKTISVNTQDYKVTELDLE